MNERITRIVSIVSAVMLAYCGGVVTSINQWPPAGFVADAYNETKNLAHYWKNDFGIEPTRDLVSSGGRGRVRIVTSDGGERDGYRLIAGLSPDKRSRTGVYLFDRSGKEVHFWPVNYDRLTTGSRDERNVFQHGTVAFPDGSIAVSFDQGEAIARIGPCGETVWKRPGNFHHSVFHAYDGTLWAWLNEPAPNRRDRLSSEVIVQLDAKTGKTLRRIDLIDDIVTPQNLQGVFGIQTDPVPEGYRYYVDPFHPNDVEILSPAMADAFPGFNAGDILISLRSLNLVGVIDGGTLTLKWWQIGPWHRQHDPDFNPDGTISVLDNNMGGDGSKIRVVDPTTGEVRTTFDGAKHGNVYTWQRGRHQMLPNGHMMIAVSEQGRAIEVDRNGNIVWSFENVFDERRNGVVNEAMALPENFFTDTATFDRCPPASFSDDDKAPPSS